MIECREVNDYDSLEEYPEVDEPPHTMPGRDDEHHLGKCISEDPSLAFEVLNDPWSTLRFESDRVGVEMERENAGFWLGLATSEKEFATLFDIDSAEDGLREEMEQINFDNTALIAGQYGVTSGSYEAEWVRIEQRESAIHVHGYILHPEERNSDATDHTYLLAVHHEGNRPEMAMLSFTIGEDVRVNLGSNEGSVQIPHRIGER